MLKKYNVVINNHETTLLLSDEDARAKGLLKVKAAPAPKNKARKTAASKGAK